MFKKHKNLEGKIKTLQGYCIEKYLLNSNFTIENFLSFKFLLLTVCSSNTGQLVKIFTCYKNLCCDRLTTKIKISGNELSC